MANNTATNLESLLSSHYLQVIETAHTHLTTDADGSQLFLILARTTGQPLPAEPATENDTSEPGRQFSPGGQPDPATTEVGQQLITFLRSHSVLRDECPPGVGNKQRCGGGWVPGGGKGGPRGRKKVKLAEAFVPAGVANNAVAPDSTDAQKELRIITTMAKLLRAGMLNGPANAEE